MHKDIDFPKVDGFPFDQETFDFMQDGYKDAIAAVAAAYGDLVIVSGVADLGASWGNGWVVVGGELLPFIGGTKAARVIVQQMIENAVFENTASKPVYFTRTAVLASSGGNLFTDFVRLTTFKKLTTDIDLIFQSVVNSDVTNALVTLLQIPTDLDRTTLLEIDMIATRRTGSIAGAVRYSKDRYLVRNLANVMTLLQSAEVGGFFNHLACANILTIDFVGTAVRVRWASSSGSVFRVKCRARVLDN